MRGHHRYHWSGRNWVIFDAGYPYRYFYGAPEYYGYDYPISGDAPFVPIEVRVQQRLAKAGYYRGRVDGVVGAGTRRAIARYQSDHSLTVNGRISGPLLDALGLS